MQASAAVERGRYLYCMIQRQLTDTGLKSPHLHTYSLCPVNLSHKAISAFRLLSFSKHRREKEEGMVLALG
ncbi:hypothetical protein HAX54_049007 [Datura stramonium]|uniref:Uncharacterized protein n=1 Tax=Datura stramonium TaxID=4076 RepID=A0ABS8SUC9_DATST|nr:hypothetical protein [Datura stramonium]